MSRVPDLAFRKMCHSRIYCRQPPQRQRKSLGSETYTAYPWSSARFYEDGIIDSFRSEDFRDYYEGDAMDLSNSESLR